MYPWKQSLLSIAKLCRDRLFLRLLLDSHRQHSITVLNCISSNYRKRIYIFAHPLSMAPRYIVNIWDFWNVTSDPPSALNNSGGKGYMLGRIATASYRHNIRKVSPTAPDWVTWYPDEHVYLYSMGKALLVLIAAVSILLSFLVNAAYCRLACNRAANPTLILLFSHVCYFYHLQCTRQPAAMPIHLFREWLALCFCSHTLPSLLGTSTGETNNFVLE